AHLDRRFLQPLRTFRRHERTLAGHRAVADMVEGLPANRSDAGLRDDVDEERARIVIFGGEAVARDVNRFDLRLGGSAAPSKLSTRMIAPGPAMSLNCCRSTSGSSDNAST